MGLTRQCTKTGCRRPSVATLTYVYADQTAVLGPLATYAEPHTYDLCADHAERLTVPRGWDAVRLAFDSSPPPPTTDDLAALADAVREAGGVRRASTPEPSQPAFQGDETSSGGRRGHLRVLRGS